MAEEVLKQETYIDFRNVKVNNNLVLSIVESGKTVDQIKSAEKVSKIIFTVLTYIFILALALLVIFPFYWMIITSLKTLTEIIQENIFQKVKNTKLGLPGGLVVRNPPANAGDTGSVPGPGRSNMRRSN